MVQLAFNATQFEPKYGSGGGGLSIGKHKVIIENTEAKPTKDTTGNYLAIILKSIEGGSAGQTQIDRLNLFNVNPMTVEIANKQLAAYCAVTGKPGINDTTELHNIPFIVEIVAQKTNPDYTEVKQIYDINGNLPGQGSAPPAAAPAQAPLQSFGAPPAANPALQTAPAQQGWAPAAPVAGQAPWGQPAAAGPAPVASNGFSQSQLAGQAAAPASASGGWGQPAGNGAAPGWSRQ